MRRRASVPTPEEIRRLRSTLEVFPAYDEVSAGSTAQEYLGERAMLYAAALQQIATWMPPARPLRVLDLGAAPYAFTALLLRTLSCEIMCVTVPPLVWPGEMVHIEHSSAGLRLDGQAWQVPVVLQNVERYALPFADGEFDVVLCMDVIQHLGYHPTLMLCEAHRVLRPDGRLLVTLPNGLRLQRLIGLLLGLIDAPPFAARGMYHRVQRNSTPREVAELIGGCGFGIERFDYLNPRLPVSRGPALWIARVAGVLTSLPLGPLLRRRDHLLIAATPRGPRRAAYPASMYHQARLYPPIPGAQLSNQPSNLL